MGGRGSRVSSPALRERNPDALANQYNDENHETGDYDANGKLTEWQNLSEEKTIDALNNIQNLDVSQYDDGYDFYDSPYQKFVLNYGLNDAATVLNEDDFNKYVQATGQPAMVRGYSSKASRDRVLSEMFHTGTGFFGDGIYFGRESGRFAETYGGNDPDRIISVALSPKARIIDDTDLNGMMPNFYRTNLGRTLRAAGRNGNQNNEGQSQWALKHGYNVIRANAGRRNEFYVALTRDALVIKKF